VPGCWDEEKYHRVGMEMALRLQQPHLCSSQNTDKGDEGRGRSGIGEITFFWKGSVLLGNSGKAGTSDEGQDGFQELHSLYVGSAILQFV
jgi:hypothetical protein